MTHGHAPPAATRILTFKNIESTKAHREYVARDTERWRLNAGMNYAQAAAALEITIRQYGMIECGVTADELASGAYPSTVKRRSPNPS